MIAEIEIFSISPITKKHYDSLMFFKVDRVDRNALLSDKKTIEIKTSGYLMKNTKIALIGHGRTKYNGDNHFESLAISGFDDAYEKPKTGLWFGLSFSKEKKIFSVKFVMVKIPNELEEEYNNNKSDIIGFHENIDKMCEINVVKNTLEMRNTTIKSILKKINNDSDKNLHYIRVNPD